VEALARARAVIAAFAQNADAGVVGVEGEMLDRPHLKRAERLLTRVAEARSSAETRESQGE
jgi:citrate lyase subunit beta/citryl-CoA lyase